VSDFEIKLPLFEGPFDLLLFFIERDELDIYDIPIGKIANDFFDYLQQMDKLNMELASEFILVASTLMRIKAKTLLPRPEFDLKGEEIDPRDELVKHLLEYKRYKSVVQELAALEEQRSQSYQRGNLNTELQAIAASHQSEMELHNLDMYKLMRVFQKVMNQFNVQQQKPTHTVIQYPYTIEGQKAFILEKVTAQNRLSFEELLLESGGKIAAVFNFLAILDLVQLGKLFLLVGEGFNNFWLSMAEIEN